MKTSLLIFLVLFCLFVSSPILAQITFTTTDVLNMYAVGKGQNQIAADDTATYTMNVGIASASQAQTWILPTAKYTDTTLLTNLTPSSTLYAKDFPLATHAETYSEVDTDFTATAYLYFRIANDSLIYIGSAFAIHSFSKDTAEFDSASQYFLKTPIALGSVITSRDSSYIEPENYTITTTTTTFDAFGSITLPNGTFQCLRGTEVDIDKSHTGTFVINDTSIGLFWITKEGHSAEVYAKSKSQTSGSISVNGLSCTEIVNVPTGAPEERTTAPNTFALLQNYPNPFNPTTTISFSLPQRSFVSLKVFDVMGREVSTVTSGDLPPGSYSRQWNATNMPSGVYFYRLQAGTYSETKKLLLLK